MVNMTISEVPNQNPKKEKLFKNIKKPSLKIETVLSLVFISLLLWLSYTLSKSLIDTMNRQKRLEQEREEVAVLSAQVERLKEEVEYYNSDSFVEKEARDKLGFVRQDEKVIVLTEEMLEEINKIEEEEFDTLDIKERKNWEKWLSFFYFQD